MIELILRKSGDFVAEQGYCAVKAATEIDQFRVLQILSS